MAFAAGVDSASLGVVPHLRRVVPIEGLPVQRRMARADAGIVGRRPPILLAVGDGLIELINPEIVESDGVQYEIEGCLSLPGKSGVTVRPKTVKVRAQNREGKWCLYKGEDLKARAFCHEIDHLDGHLYIERLAPEEVVERIRRESGQID